MRSRNWLCSIIWPLALLSIGPLGGCEPDPFVNPNISADAGQPAPAFVNIVHAVPDLTMIDLYVDKQKASPALDYRKSTGNLQITPIAHTVELRPAGASPTSPALLTANINLLPGSRTLLVAMGRSLAADGPNKLQLVATPYGTVDNKSVKLRLLNAAPESPVLDLAAGSTSLAIGASFGSASGYGSVAQLSAATKFGLRPTHTQNDLAFVTLAPMATPGTVMTVIAVGELGPTADDAHFLGASVLDESLGYLFDLPMVLNDAGPKASLFLIHAAPGAPAVDIVNDQGMKLISNLAYQQASPLLQLSSGELNVTVKPAGGMTTLMTRKLKLLPGMNWTLVADGLIGLGMKPPLTVTALPRPVDPQTSWRLCNTVTNMPSFAIAKAGQTLVPAVGFGQATDVMAAALPAPVLTLRTSDTTPKNYNVMVPQTLLDAAQDQLVTVVATGTIADMTNPLAVFAVLDNTAAPLTAPMVMPLMTSLAMVAPQK